MESLQRFRNLYLFEGALLVVFGVFAILLPGISTFTFIIFMGWLLFISGLVQGYRTFQAREAPGFTVSLISSLAFLVSGILFISVPMVAIYTITAILAVFFIIEGINKVVLSLQYRQFKRWPWLLVSGVLSLLLAGLVIRGWPGTAYWFVGLLVGIYLIFLGVAMVSIAMEVPKLGRVS